MPIGPLRDISYESIQRHRAHIHHTLRDPESVVPLDFVSMFDSGAYNPIRSHSIEATTCKDKKKRVTDGREPAIHKERTETLTSEI